MTIRQYNSSNSLTPEFKCALFKKRNNLDELINIPTKAEERSMIQILFRTQDPNIKTGIIRNPHQNSELICDPQCFQNPQIHSIYSKNPQSTCFLKFKSVNPKTYSPPLYIRCFLQNQPENVLKVFLKLFLKINYCIDYQQLKSMCKHNILIN